MNKSLILCLALFLPGCAYYNFKQQLHIADTGPVVLINKFTVAEQDQARFVQQFKQIQDYIQQQPGYISSQLHQPVGETGVWMNYARWQSAAALKTALTTPGFKTIVKDLPGRPEPMLFSEIKLN